MTRGIKPFGYFVENRQAFFDAIDRRVREFVLGSRERRLAELVARENSTTARTTTNTQSGGGKSQGTSAYSAKSIHDHLTINTLVGAGVHYGHALGRMHPQMGPYIAGSHSGIHILNLDKTLPMLKQACMAVRDIAMRGGRIVFVGTRPLAQRLTYECAMAAEQFYVNMRWLGGTITNREQVLGGGGRRAAAPLPDLLVLLDYPSGRAAVKEAREANIPVVAICDTDCDPTPITYPIPGNDDGLASIELIGRTLAQAAFDGKSLKQRFEHDAIVASARDFSRRFVPERSRHYAAPQHTDPTTAPSDQLLQ